MTHDPLEALLRLRRVAVDEARRGLAECLRIESEAAAAVAAIEAAIERETEVATSLAAGDAEVEAFAAWLRRIRPKQRAAHAAEDEAEAATVRARALLGAARAAVRAVEEMLEKHAAAAQAEAERKAQARDRRGGAIVPATRRREPADSEAQDSPPPLAGGNRGQGALEQSPPHLPATGTDDPPTMSARAWPVVPTLRLDPTW